MIKASLPFSLYFLVTLFNKVLQTQIYPEQWSRGIITPVPKSRETVNPDNYRRITISWLRLDFHCTKNWKLRIWSHLLKKSFIENFIFCAVFLFYDTHPRMRLIITCFYIKEFYCDIFKYYFFLKLITLSSRMYFLVSKWRRRKWAFTILTKIIS